MSWLRTAGLIAWTLGLLTHPARAAEAPARIEVCLTAPGFSDDVVSAVRRTIVGRLSAHLVEQVSGMTATGSADCCLKRSCLRRAAKAGLHGVLEVSVMRFGPLVRISLKAHEAALAKEVVQIKSNASPNGFPASAKSLSDDLDRGLASLGVRLRPPKPKPKVVVKPPERIPNDQPRLDQPDGIKPPPTGRPGDRPQTDWPAGTGPAGFVGGGVGVVAADRRATYLWTGGSLLAGGGVVAAVGVYLLAGPLQSALDRRRWAQNAWLDASSPDDVQRYYDTMMAADDRAKRANLIGWTTIGAGAALAVAGAVTMLLAPDGSAGDPAAGDLSAWRVAPLVGPDGGGLSLGGAW